ncbi:MAG TPA: tetratricopeptide repeat protein [Candidatus Limnocylindria bacterium]|nr:tetratricopeptide repeat protein [Candidatus Limnocylindria bacterium]
MATPNLLAPPLQDTGALQKQLAMETLEKARQERRDKHIELAETNLVSLIESPAPEEVKRGARLELALLVQDRGELAQAQQLYAQYLKLYPDDPNEPEIILRQGLIYRQMGAPVLAISKFYGVMSTALNLKSDRVDYYERLVLQAQTEIAETYYLQGKYAEASDFFSRLLKLNDSALNDAVVRGKLVRCLARLDRPGDAVTQAERYLTRYPAAGEAPEIRYLLADSLRKLGRGHDAVEQVLILLRGEQEKSVKDPAEWGQWQRRTGNDLANQLYNQGDYLDALQIYNRLLELDDSVAWQLPVQYQLGLVYERLEQPQKALDAYNFIIATVGSISPEKATPNLTTIADLARWRSQHLQWLLKIEVSRHQLVPPLLDGTEKAVVSAVK